MIYVNKVNYDRLKLTTLIILIFSLVLLVSGITYAVCSSLLLGTKNNILEAGTLSFSFNEDTFAGNGIDIKNALPMSDEKGKLMNSVGQYFDFSVNGLATIAPLSYKVLVEKQDGSTFNDDEIKVYLSLFNGSNESASKEVINGNTVLKYSELKSYNKDNLRVVYSGVIDKSEEEYVRKFRLRMWISEDVDILSDNFSSKSFSVKVKVVASE